MRVDTMIDRVVARFIGTKHERDLKVIQPLVTAINALEPEFQKLSDAELLEKTVQLRAQVKGRLGDLPLEDPQFKERCKEALEPALVPAFALVREAGRRKLGMRHFDVQLIGGIVLNEGKIAEMKTGEGKTLGATLPAVLNSLTGRGVHIVTVNDYLARRAADCMSPISRALGMTVGVIVHDLSDVERRAAYGADITYGTNNEFGFDYLRDNMKFDLADCVQRGHQFGIVDEVDSILIDEARTLLIISGPAEESTDKYYRIDKIIPKLIQEIDYSVDEKHRTATLTEEGFLKCERLLGLTNLSDLSNVELMHHVYQGLRAHTLYKRDVDYVVKNNEVVIVDEFTGRKMPGRRWSDGLHQAVEAKEGVKIERENQTLATITIQNYFRLYQKLAGMTGTAETEAAEFHDIYKLDVNVIPTNRPVARKDHNDRIYKTRREKYNAVINEIRDHHTKQQPVLVGTVSVEASELLSRMLKREKIPHNVLNAKFHMQEAEIVARAGQPGTVTISTNMAGRGTDIKLGPGVIEVGGLMVVGTERHEARRIDRQLRGRCARQGDPGASRFYVSFEDDLMRNFGAADRMTKIMERIGLEEGQELEHRWLNRSVETAQKRVEQRNYLIRKRTLDFDDVMNMQREVVYTYRNEVIDSEDPRTLIYEVINEAVPAKLKEHLEGDEPNYSGLIHWVNTTFPLGLTKDKAQFETRNVDENAQFLIGKIKEAYEPKSSHEEPTAVKSLERYIILNAIDRLWQEHLYAMDALREGVYLRGYAQKDPLIEYKTEAYDMFVELMANIKNEVLHNLFRSTSNLQAFENFLASLPQFLLREQPTEPTGNADGAPGMAKRPAGVRTNLPTTGTRALEPENGEHAIELPVRRDPKVGRNEPCPCGSGKKYKNCCGRVA